MSYEEEDTCMSYEEEDTCHMRRRIRPLARCLLVLELVLLQ